MNPHRKEEHIRVLVETNKGSKNQYVWEEESKSIRFIRTLFHNLRYPAEYGLVLNTLDEDHKALDALVLIDEPTFPGCIIHARPIGLFKMFEEEGPDHKLICIPVEDPRWNKIFNLHQVDAGLMKEIELFLTAYARFEDHKMDLEGWEDQNSALDIVREAQARYWELHSETVNPDYSCLNPR
ncbi:inorganic diphosphatase [Persicobacter sp. CCB-QB2]|uniref:inorganic diphosphatase n=1 Tax=Persicobacter sp. CCB-QB2 TaxID=1561025 RepID=UPI0006A9BF15|nr:inorganic diphosphatase [Persicobacter sp. CCB-QB2]